MNTELGLAIPLPGVEQQLTEELSVAAERLGYSSVWSSETAGSDGFTPLASLAPRTENLRLGVALAPAFTRPPALLAMTAAAMQQASGGRFALGIGSSSKVIVERWMGGEYRKPLTRVRETAEAVRLALSGEKISYHGETVRIDDFRLDGGPSWVPILIGALGPKMYGLAGSHGDGVLCTYATAERLPSLLADFERGATEAGRDPARLERWCRVPVAIDEDGPGLEQMLRRNLTAYGTVPAYNALLARQGFETEATAMAEAWAAGERRQALAEVSDELLRAIFCFGDADHCLDRLDRYRSAGLTTLVIDPVSAEPDPELRAKKVRHTVKTIGTQIGNTPGQGSNQPGGPI